MMYVFLLALSSTVWYILKRHLDQAIDRLELETDSVSDGHENQSIVQQLTSADVQVRLDAPDELFVDVELGWLQLALEHRRNELIAWLPEDRIHQRRCDGFVDLDRGWIEKDSCCGNMIRWNTTGCLRTERSRNAMC